MSKAFKRLGFLLFSITLTLCVLLTSACSEPKTVALGKYYLEGSDSVYIEILTKNKIIFEGVDFSADFERWKSMGDDFDYEASVQGIKDYEFNEKENMVNVRVFNDGVMTIFITFSYSDNKLSRRDKDYILTAESK